MRSFFARPLIFYPLIGLAAAFLVAMSLRPEWPPGAHPVIAGTRLGPSLVFNADALSAIAPGLAHLVYLARDGGPAVSGVRLARTMDSVGQDAQGALLPLAPADVTALGGQACTLEIYYRPLPITTAGAISVKWDGGDSWIEAPIEPREGTVRISLPAASIGAGLQLRVESGLADYHYGLELVELRLAPAGQSAP